MIFNKIINDNNLNYIKTLKDNSIDSIITDIPYALSNIDALKMIKEDIKKDLQKNLFNFINE